MTQTVSVSIPADEITRYGGLKSAIERAMEKLNESSYIKQLSRLLRTIEEAYDDYEHDTKKVAAVKADMDSLRRKVDEL